MRRDSRTRSRTRAALRTTFLALVVFAAWAVPAQADPHPGDSTNVAIIDGVSVINGGSFPTTTSGPTGAFTDFTFTNLPTANVSAANLAGFDTVLLNVASPGMSCDVGTLTAGQQADLASFLNGGGKLIIYDSECQPQDYSWLPRPFATANPGALGGTGTMNIVEQNLLASNNSADPHFIDEQLLGQQTDAVGDMNVLTTNDPNICLHMSGTNAAQQTGATHVYYPSGSGLLIYNGFDVDFLSTGTSPDASTPAGNLAKIWLQELQQPLDGQGLACGVSVVGISLTPADATNPAGTTHTVTAKRTDTAGDPVSGDTISFTVTGANAGATGTCSPATCVADANGEVKFTYTGTNLGVDEIVACFTPSGGSPTCSRAVKKTWTQALPGPYKESCGASKKQIGTDAGETITGTTGSDLLKGKGGNDKIAGLESDDCLFGNKQDDKMKGGDGDDLMRGGDNDDIVKGNAGKDDIRLNDGKDKANGGPGNDKIKAQGQKRSEGGIDTVNCGSGDEDRTTVDPWDEVKKNCEHVTVV